VEGHPADPELKRPVEAIVDLEPEEQATADVSGGAGVFLKRLE